MLGAEDVARAGIARLEPRGQCDTRLEPRIEVGGSLRGSAFRGWSLGTRKWGVFHGKSGQVNRGELNDMADGDRFAANGTVNDVSERMRTDGTQ